MKTSAESLLITISNAQRARQPREGERIKGERGREEERESGLSCAEARIAKLNEHEKCTVSGRASGTAQKSSACVELHACVHDVTLHPACAGLYTKGCLGMCLQGNKLFLCACNEHVGSVRACVCS